MKLHGWIYEIVTEVCYDRDYLYACYVRHFSGLMNDVFAKGACWQSGEYEIKGMKSNKDAHISWQLERRLGWMGSNVITLSCRFESLDIKNTELTAEFDLSTGNSLD